MPLGTEIGIDEKKKTIYASEQNPEARWRFLAWIRGIDPHRLVFVDESGFNVAIEVLPVFGPGQRLGFAIPEAPRICSI